MFESFWNGVKNNHFAMMALCCILPIIAIFTLQFIGFNNSLVYPVALALCIGAHLVMMYSAKKEGKTCH